MKTMHRLCISLTLLLCATSVAHAFRGECVLQVKGVSYIDGSCDVTMEKGGYFEVSSSSGRLYFAQIFVESDGSATGSWNGTSPGTTHAHSDLGALVRQGACWVNEQAKICAWRPGTRKR